MKNLNADRVDGKSAEDFLPAASMRFAVVGADGAIGASRGVPANAKAAVSADGSDRVIAVPFAADVTHCAATASPTATTSSGAQLVVGTGGDAKSIVVREPDATAAVGFHLQVTC